MTKLEPKHLIKKLNALSTKTLEQAAGLCLKETHYEITLEHWLNTLIAEESSDFYLLLTRQEVDIIDLKQALRQQLTALPKGNTTKPVFSPVLFDWIEAAWLLASVNLNYSEITSACLLLTACTHPYVRDTAYGHYLNPLAKKDLASLLPFSQEAKPAHDIVEATNSDSALAQFCDDLTEKAKQGKFDPVYGREHEMQQVLDILGRRRKNNPILVGEAGVGKTALAEGLALKIIQNAVPSFLKGVRLLSLDLGLLEAGASIKGEFEKRLKAVLAEIKASAIPIIVFVDEAHSLIGSGGQAGHDAASLLKPALSRGEIRLLAATTWAEYKKYFEKDAALARRFQPVRVPEPNDEMTLRMLQSLRNIYEQSHGVTIEEDALENCVKLASRFLTERQQPDKSIDLLDTACARIKNRSTDSTEVLTINTDTIAQVVSDWTGIPLGKVLRAEAESLMLLPEALTARLKGQDEAIHQIAEHLKLAKAGLKETHQPLGVFLLVGPSGVGKTETALTVADTLFGGEQHLITINMSEFQEKHTLSRLIGSPPGYVGYGEGGILTEAVRKQPYSVVLLDEVEKASLDVLNLFYQVFDKGLLNDGEGREISFRNTVIFLTSNLATAEIMAFGQEETPAKLADITTHIYPILSHYFKPALLARMAVIPYRPLNQDALHAIITFKLAKIALRLQDEHKIKLRYDAAVTSYILSRCLLAETGARNIDAILKQEILPRLAEPILSHMLNAQPLTKLNLCLRRDTIKVTAKA